MFKFPAQCDPSLKYIFKGLHQMIAHIAVLQDQPASANKTGKVVNAEEMSSSKMLACGRVYGIRGTLTQQGRTTKIVGTHRRLDLTTCRWAICVLIGRAG